MTDDLHRRVATARERVEALDADSATMRERAEIPEADSATMRERVEALEADSKRLLADVEAMRRLACVECGALPDDEARGWRAILRKEPVEVVLYCPGCAFGELA